MSLFDGFLDEAAVFPPGLKPWAQAVPGHTAQRSSWSGLVLAVIAACAKTGRQATFRTDGVKATTGPHHAVRDTGPPTGFERHGFLRDGARVAALVSAVDPGVRESFRSFGTCGIVEPVTGLTGVGLVTEGVRA